MQSDASMMSGSLANDIAPLDDLEGDEDGEWELISLAYKVSRTSNTMHNRVEFNVPFI